MQCNLTRFNSVGSERRLAVLGVCLIEGKSFSEYFVRDKGQYISAYLYSVKASLVHKVLRKTGSHNHVNLSYISRIFV